MSDKKLDRYTVDGRNDMITGNKADLQYLLHHILANYRDFKEEEMALCHLLENVLRTAALVQMLIIDMYQYQGNIATTTSKQLVKECTRPSYKCTDKG